MRSFTVCDTASDAKGSPFVGTVEKRCEPNKIVSRPKIFNDLSSRGKQWKQLAAARMRTPISFQNPYSYNMFIRWNHLIHEGRLAMSRSLSFSSWFSPMGKYSGLRTANFIQNSIIVHRQSKIKRQRKSQLAFSIFFFFFFFLSADVSFKDPGPVS
jgi:hypothetical protein